MDVKEVRDAWVRLRVAQGRFEELVEDYDAALSRAERWNWVLGSAVAVLMVFVFGPWSFPDWYGSVLLPIVGGISGYGVALVTTMSAAGRRAVRARDESQVRLQAYRSSINLYLFNPHARRPQRSVES